MLDSSDEEKSLFDRFKGTSAKDLTNIIEHTDHLEKEHERALERKSKTDDYRLSKHGKQIKVCALWLVAASAGIIALVLIVSLIYLLIIFISDVSSDIIKTTAILKEGIQYLLVILSTLMLERIF